MNRVVSFMVAASIAVTSAATSFVPAQALPRIAPVAVQDGANADIQQVARRPRWKPRRYGSRHQARRYSRPRHYVQRYPRHYRRNYYSGYGHHHRYGSNIGVGVTLGIVGLAAGAIVGSGYYGGLSWHEACARKYRSFNWNTGLYLGYDGHWHRCVL